MRVLFIFPDFSHPCLHLNLISSIIICTWGSNPRPHACLLSSLATALLSSWCLPSLLVSFNLYESNICLFFLPNYVELSSKNLRRCLPWLFLHAVIFLKFLEILFYSQNTFLFCVIFLLFFINSV